MFPCKITYQGISYNSSEALFQSLKLKNVKEREQFSNIDGYTSKKLGKRVKLREDWEEYKIKAMKIALYSKFTQNKELAIKLINTNYQLKPFYPLKTLSYLSLLFYIVSKNRHFPFLFIHFFHKIPRKEFKHV